MRYFDHDTHAADDDAIMALRLEHGGAAVDCYWTLLEKMYRDETALNLFGSDGETNVETKSVSHRLCIGSEELKTYVLTMLQLGLLNGTVENLYSERAMQNIDAYRRRTETARQNGKKGGRKPTKKPKPNRVCSKPETEKEPSGLQEKKRKDMGLLNVNPISDAERGAAAGEPAPLSACPICDGSLERTNSHKPNGSTLYRCNLCGEEVWS